MPSQKLHWPQPTSQHFTKIADADTLDVVLRAVVRPLVQINWPERYLSPVTDPKASSTTEERRKKYHHKFTTEQRSRNHGKGTKKQPNTATRSGCLLKLKRMFLNEGTQRETEEKFLIHSKQLSKLLSGKCYLGGKDKKGTVKRKRKSLSLSTAVKDPDDISDN